MSLAKTLCRKGTNALTRPAVRRRYLAGVEGLEHVPEHGPFVLISNHVSFAEHFVYEAILHARRGRRGVFLTKAESFRGIRTVWYEAMGAVAVDRDQPARALLELADTVLADGDALVVYPEGTRNRGSGLQPFKDGGFRFAARADVPVIPAAVWGTQDILPIGATMPRNGRARVAFGPALRPDPDLRHAARLRDLVDRGRSAVADLIDLARHPATGRSREAARRTAAVAGALVERALDGPEPDRDRLKRAAALLEVADSTDPDNPHVRLVRNRLAGLRLLGGPAPLRPLRALALRGRLERAATELPTEPMAHYLLGRWHLTAPGLLGGSPDRAARHLAEAVHLDGGDTRYTMARAEALRRVGREREALDDVESVLDAPAADERGERRRRRAAELRAALTAAAATPTAEVMQRRTT
ncbi:lysophospholipid acyltransferase family protein [Glycomyces xiaoerkulensis]|uniref:lysophospholipid acyltransferase family protein n=1 Tax=Glycomyces xiaoerkulensis TaxID=2038139 RepID=UPI000C25FCC3|nr:lysophospholipid acyltransferase family protein [Glycomyces xiaoerkulensis]